MYVSLTMYVSLCMCHYVLVSVCEQHIYQSLPKVNVSVSIRVSVSIGVSVRIRVSVSFDVMASVGVVDRVSFTFLYLPSLLGTRRELYQRRIHLFRSRQYLQVRVKLKVKVIAKVKFKIKFKLKIAVRFRGLLVPSNTAAFKGIKSIESLRLG